MHKNPLLRAIFVIYTAWYLAAYGALALLRGYPFHFITIDYAMSLIAMVLGTMAGLYATLGIKALDLHLRELEIKGGDVRRGARVSLGNLPRAAADEPQPAASTTKEATP